MREANVCHPIGVLAYTMVELIMMANSLIATVKSGNFLIIIKIINIKFQCNRKKKFNLNSNFKK